MPYEFADQEAPQAHAQEEAQEDAPAHAPPASQVTTAPRATCPDEPLGHGMGNHHRGRWHFCLQVSVVAFEEPGRTASREAGTHA